MEPKCRRCDERPRCPESNTGLCYSCLQSAFRDERGDKSYLQYFGRTIDRPIDYPPVEASA